jgi:hypothetical protein
MVNNSTDKWNFINTSEYGGPTSGGRNVPTYIPQEVVRIIEPVMKALSETKNTVLVAGVREVIRTIIGLLLQLNRSNLEIGNLPPLIGANLEDGTFLMEWLWPNYRVGFIIDPNPKDSIWYLIKRGESSDSNLSGGLNSREGREALSQLISYVALNS